MVSPSPAAPAPAGALDAGALDVALEPAPRRGSARGPLVSLVVAVLVLVGAVALAAGAATSGDRLAAPQTWAQVAARTEAAGSARVELTMRGPGMDRPLVVTGAYDFDARVMRMQVDLADALGGLEGVVASPLLSLAGTASVVVAGDATYVRFPLLDALPATAGKWIRIDLVEAAGASPGLWDGADPAEVLDLLRAQGIEVTTVGSDAVRGVATTRSQAVLDLEALASSWGAAPGDLDELREVLGDTTATVDVWVDAAGRARRLAVDVSTAEGPVTVALDLFDFGADVDTSVPAAGDVIDLGDLEGSGLFGR